MPVTTDCARSPPIAATSTAESASASGIRASSRWCKATCWAISESPSRHGSRISAARSPTMPTSSPGPRIRAFRTRSTWPWRREAGPTSNGRAKRPRTTRSEAMGFKMGIVGLPNVGKSTLFNALTQTAAAQAANYPFCTIEPNVGDVAVPDERLETLAGIAGSAQIIPTRLTFVDIAGLVRGASKGEGLGNQFLANIREVDAIAHVVRCFEDSDVTHVEGKISPIDDIETIETELMLADLESIEKRVQPLEKKAKSGDKEAKELADLMNRCLVLLRDGKPARLVQVAAEERKAFEM